MRNTILNRLRDAKAVSLAALASGMLYASACSVTDVRHNVIAGTQSFIKSYTTDLWLAFVPSADELVSGSGEDE